MIPVWNLPTFCEHQDLWIEKGLITLIDQRKASDLIEAILGRNPVISMYFKRESILHSEVVTPLLLYLKSHFPLLIFTLINILLLLNMDFIT